MLYLLQVSQQK